MSDRYSQEAQMAMGELTIHPAQWDKFTPEQQQEAIAFTQRRISEREARNPVNAWLTYREAQLRASWPGEPEEFDKWWEATGKVQEHAQAAQNATHLHTQFVRQGFRGL